MTDTATLEALAAERPQLDLDTPRILRKDMTALSELALKYRGMGLAEVELAAIAARNVVAMALATYDPRMSLTAQDGEPTEPSSPAKEVKADGLMMLSRVLADAGFVSSSGRGAQAITAGVVRVGFTGEEPESVLKDKPLSGGDYTIVCGEVTEEVRVR